MSERNVLVTLPLSDKLIETLQSVAPQLRFHIHPLRAADNLPDDLLPEIEILYTVDTMPQPESMPRLAWIQFHYAGIDHVADHPLLRSGVQITTMSGASAPQMAEFAVMCVLALARRLPLMMVDKGRKHWDESRMKRFRPVDVRGSTVGIVGYGSVAREIARLCHAMGATVLAAKRDLRQLKDLGYMPEGLGDPQAELVERLYPPEAIRSMVSLCDFVVITVPLSPQTQSLIGSKVLESMKPSAFLIDISRGGTVDHEALLAALTEGKLAGAALDVYPEEPLPKNSPLWEMENVILSPHVAGASSRYHERAVELFAINLRRYLAGQPLLNRYDVKRGY